MADTGSAMLKLHEGRRGDVVRGIGGTLVSPQLELSDVQEYFGDIEGFPEIEKLLEIVGGGASAPTQDSVVVDLNSALEYGNHRSVDDHLPQLRTTRRQVAHQYIFTRFYPNPKTFFSSARRGHARDRKQTP